MNNNTTSSEELLVLAQECVQVFSYAALIVFQLGTTWHELFASKLRVLIVLNCILSLVASVLFSMSRLPSTQPSPWTDEHCDLIVKLNICAYCFVVQTVWVFFTLKMSIVRPFVRNRCYPALFTSMQLVSHFGIALIAMPMMLSLLRGSVTTEGLCEVATVSNEAAWAILTCSVAFSLLTIITLAVPLKRVTKQVAKINGVKVVVAPPLVASKAYSNMTWQQFKFGALVVGANLLTSILLYSTLLDPQYGGVGLAICSLMNLAVMSLAMCNMSIEWWPAEWRLAREAQHRQKKLLEKLERARELEEQKSKRAYRPLFPPALRANVKLATSKIANRLSFASSRGGGGGTSPRAARSWRMPRQIWSSKQASQASQFTLPSIVEHPPQF